MYIHDFARDVVRDSVRVSARVTWEDLDRADQEIYFETDSRFGDDLAADPNAFLLASAIPAMHFGQKRIRIEGALCPQLRNGLITAMGHLSKWYGGNRQHGLLIEPTRGFKPPMPRTVARTASFMSGGVDALATFRANRVDFPPGHPGSIRDCLFIHGFDLGGYPNEGRREKTFRREADLLTQLATSHGAQLIPVVTNIRHLEGEEASPFNNYLFTMQSHGACLAAVAHAFSRRISTALIASTYIMSELTPWGSHPLLDSNYSTSAVEIRHDGSRWPRLQKVKSIADWDAALNVLRACANPLLTDGTLNCGRCEKCLRTMTQLLVFDALKRCSTYPFDDVTPDHLAALKPAWDGVEGTECLLLTRGSADLWRHLRGPLLEADRTELVGVIDEKLKAFDDCHAGTPPRRWKQTIRRVDQTVLGGTVRRTMGLVRGLGGFGSAFKGRS